MLLITIQLFIWAVSTEFEVTKELTSKSICETTKGNSIFKLEKTRSQYNLKWNLLKNVTSDGGKNMCVTEKGLVGQINKTCGNVKCIWYCKPMVIHQQVLCGKHLNLSCLIDHVLLPKDIFHLLSWI